MGQRITKHLWAIRMIVHSGTRDTPFNLAFGVDVVSLVEMGLNLIRVAQFNPTENEVGIHGHLLILLFYTITLAIILIENFSTS